MLANGRRDLIRRLKVNQLLENHSVDSHKAMTLEERQQVLE